MTVLAGLYRATVTNAADPLGRHRLQVAAAVLSSGPAWAEACMPAGSTTLPAKGSTVWLQFEAGDASRPVWIGVHP